MHKQIEQSTTPTTQKYLLLSGITVLLAFFAATQTLGRSPYHSDLRGAAQGAVATTGFLEFIWVVVGVTYAAMRWRITTTLFRIILVLNSLIATLLAAESFR